jgi:hypothetical protein
MQTQLTSANRAADPDAAKGVGEARAKRRLLKFPVAAKRCDFHVRTL